MCSYFGESEGPAFYDQRIRRARKTYECEGCGGRINVGETHQVESFAAERGSRPETQRVCLECVTARHRFSEAHDGEVFPLPSYLRQTIQECIREEPESGPRWQPLLDAMEQRKARVAGGVLERRRP